MRAWKMRSAYTMGGVLNPRPMYLVNSLLNLYYLFLVKQVRVEGDQLWYPYSSRVAWLNDEQREFIAKYGIGTHD